LDGIGAANATTPTACERATACGAVVSVYADVVEATAPNGARHSEVAGEQEFRDPLAILIIDDCTLHRDNLAAALTLNGMAAPSVAWDLPSLIDALNSIDPDIVLLDIASHDRASLLRAATGRIAGGRVIVLGASEDHESEIVACAEAGVVGYHMRTDSLQDLLRMMREVATGQTSCTPKISTILLRRISALASQRQPVAKGLALTTRETQVLKMLELGRSNLEIAEQLSITVHTVKNHVHSLLNKLGVGTRADAAVLSRTLRLRQA
jgi:DNA-binding NarL/FixJ family response regulator